MIVNMKKIIKLLLLISWMYVIFFFSSQVAKDSTITTNFVVDFLYALYNKIMLNAISYGEFVLTVFKPIRKIAHFTEFAILGALIYLNIVEYKKNRVLLLSVILSLLYATSDEIHQIFVEGRAFSVIDILIDTCGAAVGIVLIHLLVSKCLKK